MTTSNLMVTPTPDHLTLLLKHGKSTTVLSILPSQKLIEVKAILLTALRARNISTLPNSDTSLPIDPKDLELAILADRRDPAKGWVSIEDGVSLAASKSNKKKSTIKMPGQIDTVGDLELRDGAWVAYRLKVADDELVQDNTTDDDIKMREDQDWNVTIPSYDDEDEDDISMPADGITVKQRLLLNGGRSHHPDHPFPFHGPFRGPQAQADAMQANHWNRRYHMLRRALRFGAEQLCLPYNG